MIKSRIDEFVKPFRFEFLQTCTLLECVSIVEKPTPSKIKQVYFICGWDHEDKFPLYIGVTQYGMKRVKEHCKGYGSVYLKHIIDCSIPKSFDFAVYFYRPVHNIGLNEIESELTVKLRPWIKTGIRQPQVLDMRFRVYVPEYIKNYLDRVKIDGGMRLAEEKEKEYLDKQKEIRRSNRLDNRKYR